MGTVLRALTMAALFISCFLVFLPAQVLRVAGVTRAPAAGLVAWLAISLVVAGAALALWCVLAFAVVGKGTPMPLDPPQRLVVAGPYRVVRNPMYGGALVALAGAAIVTRSWGLGLYTILFFLAAHAFLVLVEEPGLRARFGDEYDAYCRRTGRWLPRFRGA